LGKTGAIFDQSAQIFLDFLKRSRADFIGNSLQCNLRQESISYDLIMGTKPKRVAVYPMSLVDAIAALLRRNPAPRRKAQKPEQQLNQACVRS
jgi:hypothetical protein